MLPLPACYWPPRFTLWAWVSSYMLLVTMLSLIYELSTIVLLPPYMPLAIEISLLSSSFLPVRHQVSCIPPPSVLPIIVLPLACRRLSKFTPLSLGFLFVGHWPPRSPHASPSLWFPSCAPSVTKILFPHRLPRFSPLRCLSFLRVSPVPLFCAAILCLSTSATKFVL